jgi:hypothetical protein
MCNEYDYTCKGFELKAVPRSEFEVLKRFGDYTELHDGTLMPAEGDMEFRIYCEDVEGCDWYYNGRRFEPVCGPIQRSR